MSHDETSHDDVRDRLDALLDGELDDDVRRRIVMHLESCEDCAAELAWLRGLRRRTASLPRKLQPSRDLWPGIAERLRDPEVGSASSAGGRRPGGGWRRWAPLAAAAVLLMALSAGITARWMSDDRPPDPGAAGITLAEMRSAERQYREITEELLAILDERRDRLDPETARVVDENLRIIDEAIDEMRAALRRDPADAGLASRLTGAYRKRVELLRKAAAITT